MTNPTKADVQDDPALVGVTMSVATVQIAAAKPGDPAKAGG